MSIDGLPDLPHEIVKASEQKRLVLFLGAGLSCSAGLKSWRELKEILIEEHLKTVEQDKDIVKARLTGLDYYDCFSELKSQNSSTYRQVMKDNLTSPNRDMREKFQSLFDSLKTLKPASVVTLNMDTFLLNDQHFDYEQRRTIGECWPWELPEGNLFFFHGYAGHSSTGNWVFDRDELEKRYNVGDASRFLHGLFSGHYVVLFVGFSFSDKRILDHMRLPDPTMDEIFGIPSRKKRREPFHYALVDSKSVVDENSGCNTENLKKFGIRPLVYRHVENADQLIAHSNFDKTLEHWATDSTEMVIQSQDIPENGPQPYA